MKNDRYIWAAWLFSFMSCALCEHNNASIVLMGMSSLVMLFLSYQVAIGKLKF